MSYACEYEFEWNIIIIKISHDELYQILPL